MSRKKIIILTSVFLFFASVAFILYFLLVFRAESSLQRLVKNQSDGKLILKVKRVKLDVFHLRFDFQQPELRTIDSSNTNRGYHIKADRISFRVHSLISVFSGKHLVIDSVIVQSPLIEVIKYKAKERSHRKISLPHEMSKVYESLEKVLSVLNLNYLHISNAKLRIYDRSQPGIKPLTVSNINLTVDDVSKKTGSSDGKFLFADRILLEIYNENLVLPDGDHGISFKRLWIGTRTQTIKLDSCLIYGKSSDTAAGEFSIFIDSLRIKKLDFNALAKDNTIRLDSALCINPVIRFNLTLADKGKKPQFTGTRVIDKDSIDNKIKHLLGNLEIGYLTVRNADVNISASKNDKVNIYNTDNSNFSFGGLVIRRDQDVPIKLGFLDLNIQNYTGYSPDSLYVVTFDNIIFRENRIRLNNFRISPSGANRDLLKKDIIMQTFELDDIDWMALLYENRIVAGHASLIRPEVHIKLPEAKKNKSSEKKVNPFLILDKIKDKIQIGKLFIEEGNMTFDVLNGPKISLNNCYAGINVDSLLAAGDELKVIDALDTLSFRKGELKNSGMYLSLLGGSYSKIKNSLFFKQLTENKSDKSQSVVIKNLALGGVEIFSFSEITLDELSWGNAKVSMKLNPSDQKKAGTSKLPSEYKFTIKKISGGPTQLSVKNQNLEASTVLSHISTGEIVVENGQKPKISGLFIDGQSINLDQQDKLNGSFSTFKVLDSKPSALNNVLIKLPVKDEILSILVPRLTFSMDIQSSLNGDIRADYFELSNPVITFAKNENFVQDTLLTSKKSSKLPVLHIKRITIDQPEIVNLPEDLSAKIKFEPGKTRLDILGIKSDSKELSIDHVNISASQPKLETGKFRLNPTGNEKIDFKGSAFIYIPADEQVKSKWSFNLNDLKLSGLQMSTFQNDSVKQTIALRTLNIENLHMNDSSLGNPQEFIRKNNRLRISDAYIKLGNSKTNVELSNLSFNKSTNCLALDSMTFCPVLDRDSFMKTQDFQAVHIHLHTGKINVKDIDFNTLLKDTVISSKKITISDVHLLAYKDKRLPFHHGIYKPMLTDLLLNIKPKIIVDSVIVKNGLIEYEEFNDKTQQFGQIKLSRIKGAIGGVRTFSPMSGDSLKFNIYARLLDTADLRLRYKQSYTDSLSGFNLKLVVSSFNLTALNPMLRPFASAELKSGNLDTIRMSVIGRKYVAFGVMKMYYSDLNAQLIKQGDSINKNFVTKSVSFLANRIVHTKNKRGIGQVYAERDSEKGFVNYWVKIVIGGVLTNAGVRTNKKQVRKYEKGLKIYEVPPIPDIPVDY